MGGLMLETLLGSINAERTLIFLLCRDEGYAREIARFYNTYLSPIQNQLNKLEENGVLISKLSGRTRNYSFNPRYPFLQELRNLLDKAFSFYPEELKSTLLYNRRRPRRRNKPL